MNIVKGAQSDRREPVTAEELAAINALTRRELSQEEVYLFSVRLCDNEIDREGERFPKQTLEELAPLFVGKSGMFDHQWSARGQTARIYKTEVVEEPGRLTRAGDGYCWLKGCAYMLRSEGNQELIDEIDAGIKKEVSVGCSVARKVCSICGAEVNRCPCDHQVGQEYDGRLCYISLEQASDAYEFSFVAVPAQPGAGVVKGLDFGCADLHAVLGRFPNCQAQFKALEEEARLGRAYRRQLREEVVRLGLLAGMDMEAQDIRAMVQGLDDRQAEQLRKAWQKQAQRRYPLQTQLRYQERPQENRQQDAAFLI